MRFSDLKKKLLLLVGVIAAFALLGSMMLPSISEKMGLDADSCFASGYEGYDEDDSYYYDQIFEYDEEYDAHAAMMACMVDCEERLKRTLIVVKIICERLSKGDEETNKVCYEAARAIVESNYLDEVSECIEMYSSEYPDTPPWERP